MQRHTTRKIELFDLHVKNKQETKYLDYFKLINSINPNERVFPWGDRIIAFPYIKIESHLVKITVFEGENGIYPLIYNILDSTDRIEQLRDGEVIAHKTHCLFYPDKRKVIIEYNHRGAKTEIIGEALEFLLQKQLQEKTLFVEINPVADETFLKAIEKFNRIRLASLKIARPNYDWTDFSNKLTEAAAESEGHKVEITITAQRSRSLSKEHGIFNYIRELVRAGVSIIKGAKIIGVRQDESAETTVSLSNFIKHQKITVNLTEGGIVDAEDIYRKMKTYILEMTQEGSAHND